MTLFDKIYSEVLRREGGSAYTNDPSDRGGKTRYGVTEALARRHGYKGNMKDLPEDFARGVYKEEFWDGNRLDDVASLSEKVAAEVYDSGVNVGPARAARWLQASLNVFNYGAGADPDLVVDGRIGRATLNALRDYLAKRGDEGVTVLLRALNGYQFAHYANLAEADHSQRKFTYGWVRERVQGDFK